MMRMWIGVGLLAVIPRVASAQDAEPTPAPSPVLRAMPAVEEPPTGTSWFVAGGVAVGLGAVGFASVGICQAFQSKITVTPTGAMTSGSLQPCLWTALGAGIGFMVPGAALIVIGAMKRSAWKEWDALPKVKLVPVAGGATLTWRGTF
jgi:hypothetical protein